MSAGPTGADEALAVAGILRAALALLRRRPFLYAALAILLVLLPDLLSEPVADAVTSALPAADKVSEEQILPDLLIGLGAAFALTTILLAPVVLAAIVVSTALAPQHRLSLTPLRVLTIVRRGLPLVVAISAAEIGLAVWASEHGWVPGSALSSVWLVSLPVLAAENARLSSLPGRLRALARGHRPVIARLLVAYLILCMGLGEIQSNLPDFLDGGSLKTWTLQFSASALIAASALLADAMAVALYLKLRQVEAVAWSSNLAQAFD